MLRCLLLLLLVLGLSAPAVAMTGHCGLVRAEPAMHGCHEQTAPSKGAAPAPLGSDCIGCAAPWTSEPALLAASLLADGDHERPKAFTLPSATASPETPPPRA